MSVYVPMIVNSNTLMCLNIHVWLAGQAPTTVQFLTGEGDEHIQTQAFRKYC